MVSDVAEARGAEHGIGDRVADDIGVRVAERTAGRWDRDAAEHERAAVDEPVQVVAEADRRFARFSGFSEFSRFAEFAGRDRFGERPVLGRRDLDVRRFTVDEPHRATGAFDERRLVGRVAALLAER